MLRPYKILKWRAKLACGEIFCFLQALGAVAANFRARDGDLHVEIARDLLLQLLVQAAFEFPNLAAAQARHMNVIARTVRLVIVAVPAKMQQIQFVNKALLLQQVNRAVHRNEVDVRINLLRPGKNLIHIQVLLGIIHHLKDHAALPGHADSAPGHCLLKLARCLRGIEALSRGSPVRR